MSSYPTRTEAELSFGLAFVGGYGDAVAFVLAKTFTGHVTGNLVLAAVSAVGHDSPVMLSRFSAVLSFLAGILLSVLLARLLAARPSGPYLSAVLAAELILVVGSYLALISHAIAGTEIFVICLALALGLQNGAFHRAGHVTVHTTYITGMITSLMLKQAEQFVPQADGGSTGSRRQTVRLLSGVWLSFFLGAAAGAAMVMQFKEAGILGVTVILFVLIVRNSMPRSPLRSRH